MKTTILKSVMAVLVALFSLNAYALVEIDGIYYNIVAKAKQAEVTSGGGLYNYRGKVTIPESIIYKGISYPVAGIGNYAFGGCSGLTSVNIPNSVTSIGDGAFYGCSGLTSVTIPGSVTSIGNSAFFYCSSLTSVTIPSSVTSIGKSAFFGCNGLTSIIVESGNPVYDSRDNCNAIIETSTNTLIRCCSKTKIPNSVISIGNSAFGGCSGLTSVTIPGSVTSIGVEAFLDCSGLTSVTIPNSVTSIGDGAFYGCSGLTSVTIPGSVTSIGVEAFLDCSGLTSVTIPNSVTSIGDGAFYGCSGLTSIIVESGNPVYDSRDNCNAIIETSTNTLIRCCSKTKIPNSVISIGDHAFSGCSGLTSVTIPGSVTSIGNYAFLDCSSLTSVTIPSSVISIGYGAFGDCSGLTSVTIPSSVTSIGSSAFHDCMNLTDVFCYSENVPKTSEFLFYGTPIESATLHVRDASIEQYKSDDVWGHFGAIVSTTPIHKLYYIVDGDVYKIVEMKEDEAITPEEFPQKEGHTFSGWSEIPVSMPTKDVAVTGSFTANTYKLTYVVDGRMYKTYEVEYKTPVMVEEEPTKEGYIFSGWGEIPTTMPAQDVFITGTFTKDTKGEYTLRYILDGKTYRIFSVDFGAVISPEAEPKKEGYTFSGWSEIPQTMPNMHVTITGSFTINKYTLTYKVDGEIYKTLEVEYNTPITVEEKPEKKGCSFSGWSEIPEKMPAHNVTITGSFARNILAPSYKRHLSSQTTGVSSIIIGSFVQKSVGFNLSNNGTESINVTKLVVKNPNNNYSVILTSTDASLLGKLDGGSNIGLSVNLTADFTPCYEWHYTYKGEEFVFCSDEKDPAYKHDITYYVDDEVYVTYEPDLGDEILPEEEPTKEGYTFSGWSEIPETMPAKDIVVTGNFTSTDVIDDVTVNDDTYQIYTLDGKPVGALQKGVNIIRLSGGQIKKVLVK